VDAQSVKNTDTAALKGYDAGKKVSGIKRHIAVTTAERKDRKGALLCDSGYGGKPFAQGVQDIVGTRERTDRQTQRASHVPGDALALGGGALLCVAAVEQAVVEELPEVAQHPLAVDPLGVPGSAAQKILNRFLEVR
jgi:hypothetical protein